MNNRTFFYSILFFPALFCLILPGYSFAAAQEISLEGVPQSQVDAVLAKLSDEQVRGLLIQELAKDLEAAQPESTAPTGGMVYKATGLLHLLDGNKTETETERPGLLTVISRIPLDFIVVLRKIGNGSIGGFFMTAALLALLFGAAFLAEFFMRRFTADFSRQFKEKAIPDLDGPMRFVAGVMRAIPAFIHILVFSTTAVLLFFLLPAHNQEPVRYLFLTILLILVFFRTCRQFSRILCAPQLAELRILPVDDTTAASIHNGIVVFCTYTFSAILILALFMELQLDKSSFAVLVIAASSILIALIIIGILRSRDAVKNRILKQSDVHQTRNWIIEQFAQFWHIPTLLYFIVVWMILLNDQLSGVQRESAAFLLSLLILPLYVLFDWIGQWIVKVSVNGLNIYDPKDEEQADEEMKEQLAAAKNRQRKITVTTGRLIRLAILAALLVWVLSLWGYTIPYAADITGAVFQSLITLALGLTAWSFASSYIEKKIADVTPEEEEGPSDDEFGGAAQRGRSYTLLPLLRKVVASTLLVMVSLVVLSSLGVDIGPLLAGAGVVGLAVGFGAQKLVSDIFSGFFYLLDDAFRVGEYIQAGSVSGAVEAITLRNVMLRHHRGMLQIVPHSDLGSITNFMRGGIIVKFNLEFPYDANVDKIRKVIKKVGRAMLEDEEFGQDFIQPVKSAGVREITGSVMTIRVKFKAQPGTHFVIRREAYRRITEALNAQGIFYAHRKVIVELPEEKKNATPEETRQAVLQAGAAAQAQLEEEEKKKAAAQGPTSGMS
ncbi:MAG: mechanosensitive ion channel family protein [Desulfobulbaceae bacterium]|nr:mechanosensitive ion channel family protein [Desulfobulbaceae bacterium]